MHEAGYHQDLQHHLADTQPQVGAPLPGTDGEVPVEGVEGQEGTSHTEHAEHGDTAGPCLADTHLDELPGHEGQPQHSGHGEEGGEAQQLTEDTQLTLAVGSHFHEHGLGQLSHRLAHHLGGHEVPLVGLREIARHPAVTEVAADEEGEEVLGEGVDHVGHEHVHAEPHHLPHRLEGEMEGGEPAAIPEAAQGDEGDIGELLPH